MSPCLAPPGPALSLLTARVSAVPGIELRSADIPRRDGGLLVVCVPGGVQPCRRQAGGAMAPLIARNAAPEPVGGTDQRLPHRQRASLAVHSFLLRRPCTGPRTTPCRHGPSRLVSLASRRDHGVASLVDIRSARGWSPQARHRGCRLRRATCEAPAGLVPRRGCATNRRRRGLARRSSHLCEPVAPSRGVRPRAGRAACAATADGLARADARDPRGVEVGAALDTSHRSAPQMVRVLEHHRRAGPRGAVPVTPSCRRDARQRASSRASPGRGSRQRLCGPASPIPPDPASD